MPVWLRSRGLERRSVRHRDLSWRAEAMLESLGLGGAELSIKDGKLQIEFVGTQPTRLTSVKSVPPKKKKK